MSCIKRSDPKNARCRYNVEWKQCAKSERLLYMRLDLGGNGMVWWWCGWLVVVGGWGQYKSLVSQSVSLHLYKTAM